MLDQTHFQKFTKKKKIPIMKISNGIVCIRRVEEASSLNWSHIIHV